MSEDFKDTEKLSIDEYRIKVTVRNNLLLNAIEAAGYRTQSEFARAAGMSPSNVNALVAMREPPIGNKGEFSLHAKQIMEVLGAAPSDLWTDAQLTMRLKKNTGEFGLNQKGVEQLLEAHVATMTLPDPMDALIAKEERNVVSEVIKTLTPRQERVVRKRFGIGARNDVEGTLDEVGASEDVSRERVRQIENKALRKLRHPSRAEILAKAGMLQPETEKTILQRKMPKYKGKDETDMARAYREWREGVDKQNKGG
jgi:RNA polymerase sigma factor (sigma-70 family)